MDRNDTVQIVVVVMYGRSHKESVDRNRPVAGFPLMIGGSLSARRAWIEIQKFLKKY